MRALHLILLLLPISTLLSCEKDSLPLTKEKGIWQETRVYRRLFQNSVQIDSVELSQGFATYRFRNNGKGTYTTDTDPVAIEWYWEAGDTVLNICLNNGGLLQCNRHTVQHIDAASQTWLTRNDIDAAAYELVTTQLDWEE